MKPIITLILIFNILSNTSSQTVVQHPYFIIGADSLPSGDVDDQILFAFDEEKGGASFGIVDNEVWYRDSIGMASFAAGYNSVANGTYGIALGSYAVARGDYAAVALGAYTEASGADGATAIGSNSKATGDFGAIAIGESTVASGDYGAVALGYEAEARGDDGAIAMGYSTLASGDTGATAGGLSTRATGDEGATAFGAYTRATGNEGAIAMGYESKAIGNKGTMALGHYAIANGNLGTIALGNNTISNGNSCTVVGMFNEELVDSAQIIKEFSPIFVVGNGWKNDQRSNALIVKKDGKTGIGRNPLSNLFEVEGSASKSIAGNWLANSDRRIKKDIEDIHDSYQKVLQLRPVKFKYTNEWRTKHPEIKDHYYYNFIAQEFGEVFPNAIQGSGEFLEGDSAEILQIDTYNAQIVHLSATRELIKDIEILKEENHLLKKQLTNIESRMALFVNHTSPSEVDPK